MARNPRTMAFPRCRMQVFLGIVLALAVYAIILLNTSISSNPRDHDEMKSSNNNVTDLQQQLQLQLPHTASYQCALVWLRLPKTASTSIVKRFVDPFVKAAGFTNTDIGPNTCITHLSGCAELWNGWGNKTAHQRMDAAFRDNSFAPPYGIPYNELQVYGANNHRCISSDKVERKIYCWEYDRANDTIHYGPHRKNETKKKKRRRKKGSVAEAAAATLKNESLPEFVTSKFDVHPSLRTHVAIDTSLFGWILPSHPIVFSTFRDPAERLISSFHYGIQFGGDVPGRVRKCRLPGVVNLEAWQERVILTRLEKNLTMYQQALREYLDACGHVVDNAYVQFLDPRTKDVDIAVKHLEQYFIVGMQSDLEESLQRITKIAINSCRDHPKFEAIRKALTNTDRVGSHYRESVSLLRSKEEGIEATASGNYTPSVELASFTINELDTDLQQLISKSTVGDEVIFRRAKELYEEQGKWFRT